MKLKTVEFTLPAHWAIALVNEDYSGLDDDDDKEIASWLADNPDLNCAGCSDNAEFTGWHDAQEYCLACDCLTFTFHDLIA